MIRLICLVFSLLVVGAQAQQPADIYRVEAKVANQSEAEREAAAKATLGDVIVRATGDTTALDNPKIRQAISEAPNYLAKFSYTSDTLIVLNFSAQAIHTLLVQSQLIAAPGAASQNVVIYVVNAQDFATFKQVQAYLKTIGVVRRVELVSVNKEVMQFSLTLDGDVELLKTTLGAANKLQAVVGDTVYPLSFRWQN